MADTVQGLTVLSDVQVNDLLETMLVQELDEMRGTLAGALHAYSGGEENTGEKVFQQPRRSRTRHVDSQATTRYTPLCSPEGMACKVVSEPPNLPNVNASPTGALTLFSPTGQPLALLASPTLTSFRTALTSSCLLHKRSNVHTLTVFGAGNQAYWHIRLALMARGSTIRHVNIINHRFSDSAAWILKRFTMVPTQVKEREGWEGCKFSIVTKQFKEFGRLVKGYVRDADVIYCCTRRGADGEDDNDEGLFDAGFLTHHEGRKKGRLICAVGEGRELPGELLRLVTKTHSAGNHLHFHKHADEGGVVVVDTLEGALREAREFKSAGIEATQLVELGELVMIHRQKMKESERSSISTADSVLSSDIEPLSINDRQSSMSTVYSDKSRRSSSHSRKGSFPISFRRGSNASQDKPPSPEDDGLGPWLRDGTVVYRSVGLDITDLVVGTKLVQMANEKGMGTVVPGF